MGNLAGKSGKSGGISSDPMFAQFLNAIAGQNVQRMADTYKNLGLDTSGEAMGMSPQERKDLSWLQQGAEATGTQGFLQNAANQVANINAQNQQTAQNINQAGQAGAAAGAAAGALG